MEGKYWANGQWNDVPDLTEINQTILDLSTDTINVDDTTAIALGLDPQNNPMIDDALNALSVQETIKIGQVLQTGDADPGNNFFLLNGASYNIYDYPELSTIFNTTTIGWGEFVATSFPNNIEAVHIRYGDGYYVVLSAATYNNNIYISYSTDLRNWTQKTIAAGRAISNQILHIEYFGGYWIIPTYDVNNRLIVYYSATPGGTWQSTVVGVTYYCNSRAYIAFDGTRWIVSGYYTTTTKVYIYYSTNLTSWTYWNEISGYSENNYRGIVYLNGTYINLTSGGITYATVLGGAWTEKATTESSTPLSMNYIDGNFIYQSIIASTFKIYYCPTISGTFTAKSIVANGSSNGIQTMIPILKTNGYLYASMFGVLGVYHCSTIEGTWTLIPTRADASYHYMSSCLDGDGNIVVLHYDGSTGAIRISVSDSPTGSYKKLPTYSTAGFYNFIRAE